MNPSSGYSPDRDERARRAPTFEFLSDIFTSVTVAELERFCALHLLSEDLAPIEKASALARSIRDFEAPIKASEVADQTLVQSLVIRLNAKPIVSIPFHLEVLAGWFDVKGDEHAGSLCREMARRMEDALAAIAADIGALRAVSEPGGEEPPSGNATNCG